VSTALNSAQPLENWRILHIYIWSLMSIIIDKFYASPHHSHGTVRVIKADAEVAE